MAVRMISGDRMSFSIITAYDGSKRWKVDERAHAFLRNFLTNCKVTDAIPSLFTLGCTICIRMVNREFTPVFFVPGQQHHTFEIYGRWLRQIRSGGFPITGIMMSYWWNNRFDHKCASSEVERWKAMVTGFTHDCCPWWSCCKSWGYREKTCKWPLFHVGGVDIRRCWILHIIYWIYARIGW